MSRRALLAHRLEGQGETVLLLNGGMMSMASWDAIAAPLARTYRVLRCDFRGQFLSPGEPPARLAGHCDDLVSLLDALAVERVHVIGTSFGAEVGLLLAALHARRVASLIAATATDAVTPVLRERGGVLRRACRAALDGGDRGEVYDLMLPAFFSAGYLTTHEREVRVRRAQVAALPDAWFAGADALLASLEELDLRPHLASISCPTLVVAAEYDLVMPVEHARALATAIPSARLEIVADSGHVLVLEKPDELTEICLRFLSNVATQGGSP